MVVVEDESAGLNLFEQGKLDILSKIGPTQLPLLRKKPGVLHTDPFLATYYLSFNAKKPPFNDRLWRRAVAGALQREEIVRALDSGESPARSWVPPTLEGFISYEDPSPVFAASVTDARKRGGTILTTPLEVTFDTSARNQQVMEQVQQQLKKTLGLRLSLSNMDWKTYLATVHTDPPPLFRLGILSPFMDPIQILEAFTTGNPDNYLGWSNAEYDGLVRTIASLKPGLEREKKIIEAQRLLVDREAIVVPVYHYVQQHAVGPRILNFRVNPFGEIIFSELRVKNGGG
jgi:oligopeptide transport system substrate-binding protein